MVYKLEDKTIDLNDKKKFPLIAKGKNGNVYEYGTSAIKVFENTEEPPISEETAEYLTTINTERILLPRKLLFYDSAFCNGIFAGYSLKRVPKKPNVKKLINSPVEQLIDNVEGLEKDIRTISKKRILLSDMSPENVKYNGTLYISDPSKYTVLELPESGGLDKELEKINCYQLHLLLTELFAEELRKINFPQSSIFRLREIFSLKDSDQQSSRFLLDIIDGQGTIKEMVKKINR